MGIQVTVTLDDMLKPEYTVATVLAANFAVTTTQLAIFVGDAHAGGKSFEVSGIQRSGELVRENGNLTPLTTNVTQVIMPPPGYKPDATVVLDGALVDPTEGAVSIAFGSAFQPIPGTSVTAYVKRTLEKFIEARA